MLDKLPIEVFTEITYYLSTKEQVKCMTICQSWNDIIKNTTLMQDILFTEDRNLESLINQVQQNKLSGNQVKVLTARNLRTGGKLFRQLPLYFPHLTELSWPMALASSSSNQQQQQQQQLPLSEQEQDTFKLWSSNLEKLECYVAEFFFPDILQISSFEKLTEIYFHFRPEDHPNLTIDDLFSSLKSVPHLKVLQLDTPQITMANMETLHQSVPTLEALVLEDTELIRVSALPTIIVPAYQFKSFRITKQCSIQSGDIWMTYFAQKYNNKKMERFVVECKLGDVLLFGNILVGQFGIGHSQITPTINQSLMELLHGFGPQLKTFRISQTPMNESLLKTMDDIGMQLEELHLGDSRGKLDLINAFEESNQWNTVETLSISNYPVSTASSKRNFKVKKLFIRNLMARDNSIYLDNILEQYPNLKELTGHCTRIRLSSSSPDHHPHQGIFPLRKLRLSTQVVDDSLFEYLSRCAPMLYNVSIDAAFNYVEDERFLLNLQLPNHRLQKFSFNTHLRDFDLKVTTEKSTKYFRVNSNNHVMPPVDASEVESTLGKSRLIVMTCKSATYLRALHSDLH